MNSIRIKSGMNEVAIATDQSCSPKDLVEAAKEAMQMAYGTAMIEATRTPELPEIIRQNENVIPMEAKAVKPEKRRSTGTGDEAQAKKRVSELIAEGRFDNAELSVSDVRTILAGLTYHFEEWAVSKALAHYVRQRQLVRTGVRRKYKYSKRLESIKSQPSQSVANENTATTLDALVASQ